MPFMFIHGVNVRDKKATIHDALILADELARHVVEPLARIKAGRMAQISIDPAPRMFVPFWGDVGVQFHWDLKTLPIVRLANIQGVVALVGEPLPGQGEALAVLLEKAGFSPRVPNPLLCAARFNLEQFLGVVFAPTVFQGDPLLDDRAHTLPDRPGLNADATARNVVTRGEALLADALHDVARDPLAVDAVHMATNDVELLNRLKERVLDHLNALVNRQVETQGPRSEVSLHQGQAMGPAKEDWVNWLGDAKDRIGEFFSRTYNAPGRAVTVATLAFTRKNLNENLSRFTGDVFEYLHHRGEKNAPGPIIQRILSEIDSAHASGRNEPWFVVTHSMGGNIFYDIVTHYRPELDVEVWLSVASQVGLFEEMKLFHASDPNVGAGSYVTPPNARVARWLNIYDPADPFAYLAAPVFRTVDQDISYSTGVGGTSSHSAYFKQRSFFDVLVKGLENAYSAHPAPASVEGTSLP